MRVVILISFLFVSFGCQQVDKTETSELRFFKVNSNDLRGLVNEKPLPGDPDLTSDKTILNRDYPIEVALYNDGKWFYDLPNFGTGQGTWIIEDGMMKLNAKTLLFDMYIEVVAIKENAQEVVLKFRDRFGPRILNTEKMNQE
ncbi:MAG: hypothetical protein K9K67_14020 [Bacteriovoracaceae bacterium]|nr:hypothetical protein [Bacteriovoracaceae bacterium]